MQDKTANETALRITIEAAFAGVPYPGDENIAISDWRGSDEYRDLQRDFMGQEWRTLPIDVLGKHVEDNLFLLTPQAFRYLLPAYLVAAIDERDVWGIQLMIVYHLTPPYTLDKAQVVRFIARAQLFDKPQIAAIREFLIHIQNHDYESDCAREDAPVALKRYWDLAAQGAPPQIDELTPPPGEGVRWIRMPEVTGCSIETAFKVLSARGLNRLRTIEETHYYGSSPPGTVIRTNPLPGELALLSREHILIVAGQQKTSPAIERFRAEKAVHDAAWDDYNENPVLPNGEKKRPPDFF